MTNKIISGFLILALLIGLFIIPDVNAIEVGDSLNYTSTIRTSGPVNFASGDLVGMCVEPGAPNKESGTATVTSVLDNSSDTAKIAYWIFDKKYNVNDTGNALGLGSTYTYALLSQDYMQISKVGAQTWQQVHEGRHDYSANAYTVILNGYTETLKSLSAAPKGFKAYLMDAGNNQDFVLWEYTELPFEASKAYSQDTAAGKANAAVKVGDIITYQISWSNGENVKIEDTLSEGLAFEGELPTGCKAEGQKMTCDVTGDTGTLTYKVRVTDAAKAIVCNSAKAISGENTKDLTKLCNPVPSKIYGGTSLSDNDGWDHHEVQLGQNIKYKITLANAKEEAQEVEVTDILSKGLTYNNDVTITNGTITAKQEPVIDSETKETKLVWIVTIPAGAGQVAELNYSAKVNSEAVKQVKNNASAIYKGEQSIKLNELENPLVTIPSKTVKIPDTASTVAITGIVAGIVLIVTGGYFIYKRYNEA